MANFYTDHPEIKFNLESNSLMPRIVELKEKGYADKDAFDYAPEDFADAMDNYNRVLEVAGDITANTVFPNSEEVDAEGPHCENGRVRYAAKTYENLEATRKAGLNGVTMPRRFGGLNFPITAYTAINEMIASADAGFENIWSLQDCIETLYEFGDEDQRSRFIGVKRFITNGDSDIHLVLARSEEGTRDGRGLSMFIYDKRDGGVDVRRIENKMGIHGSPTCELVYKNAKAELCGRRKFGLIKYVMALMNGARLGIAAQSVGISQMAYNEALAYAKDRKQFGQAIVNFPAVYEMISNIKARLDAGRALLYLTASYVDIYKGLEDIERDRKLTDEEKAELKKYQKLASACTPLAKGMNSEYANINSYDSIQVHGGSGYMLEYACQRLYRDARITSIYEGTTQLQTVAALPHVTTGTYSQMLEEFEAQDVRPEYEALKARAKAMDVKYNEAVEFVKAANNNEFTDLCSRHLYEMAANCVMTQLLLRDATKSPELFDKSVKVYLNLAESEIAKHYNFVKSLSVESLESYKQA